MNDAEPHQHGAQPPVQPLGLVPGTPTPLQFNLGVVTGPDGVSRVLLRADSVTGSWATVMDAELADNLAELLRAQAQQAKLGLTIPANGGIIRP